VCLLLLLLLLGAACVSAKPKLPTPAVLSSTPCIALSDPLSMLHSSSNECLLRHLLLQQASHCEPILLLLYILCCQRCCCCRSCSICLCDMYGRDGKSPPCCLLLLLHAIPSPGPSHRAWCCCWRLPLLHEKRVHRLASPCHCCRCLLLPLRRQVLLLLLLLQRLLLLPLLLLLLLKDFLGLALRLTEEYVRHLAAPSSSNSGSCWSCCCSRSSCFTPTTSRHCCCCVCLPICAYSLHFLCDHNITIGISISVFSSSSSSSTSLGPCCRLLLLLCAPASARLLLLLLLVVVPIRVA
jgi:hypothetical protein